MILRAPLLTVLLAVALAIWGVVRPPLPALPLVGEIDRIEIVKSDRILIAYQDGKPVRRVSIALGFAPTGDKERQGDGRTPEGLFRIDRKNPQSRFHLSLGIDYPQAQDLERARTGGYDPGGDIFIHGQPAPLSGRQRIVTDWTAGCIAVNNEVMEELFAATPIGTPVEIRP